MGHSKPCFVLVAVQTKAYRILDSLNTNIVSSYPLRDMDVFFLLTLKIYFLFVSEQRVEW